MIDRTHHDDRQSVTFESPYKAVTFDLNKNNIKSQGRGSGRTYGSPGLEIKIEIL
jgi:hypothetical protein